MHPHARAGAIGISELANGTVRQTVVNSESLQLDPESVATTFTDHTKGLYRFQEKNYGFLLRSTTRHHEVTVRLSGSRSEERHWEKSGAEACNEAKV
jgi:hypothetical protein